jgi:hypothetical protein
MRVPFFKVGNLSDDKGDLANSLQKRTEALMQATIGTLEAETSNMVEVHCQPIDTESQVNLSGDQSLYEEDESESSINEQVFGSLDQS